MSERLEVTVTELNELIKQVLEGLPVLRGVCVRGEISNITLHRTGHIYMSLKDESSLIKAVMFRGNAQSLDFRPQNGMKVRVTGNIGVFTRDGVYQLYAEHMEQDGIGSLYEAYEKLKAKLLAEGLFSEQHKKPLPKAPFRIGLITAPTGAAVQDMINVTRRRFPAASILLYPSLVQGDGAEANLIKGLKYLDGNKKCDVIIIGRGGGSIEDLWAFNGESLARAIYACETPVISAVGHETDFTICDLVADRRAPTPSAAAEIAVPDRAELKKQFRNLQNRLAALTTASVEKAKGRLAVYSQRPVLKNPVASFNERRMTLLRLDERLLLLTRGTVQSKSKLLSQLSGRLTGLSPLSVLSRGYAAVFDKSGAVVCSASSLKSGNEINVRFGDGAVDAEVK